ncbi:MAG: SDR family NAD(P)-dependent oxidoreductase [Candidatus Promineifilaceae bacterium]|jgi:NAD(P)-dependent dehydrogenase (short-subunit alcohol dehydrogenase family)
MQQIPIQELLNFSGKVVLVTGSGSGLGRGIALRFGEAGASVVVNYRSREAGAREVVRQIEQGDGTAVSVQADVSRRDDVERLVETAVMEYGRLDVLINNAGIYPIAPFLDITDEEWEAMIDANLRSVFLCTQVAAKQMINQTRIDPDISGAIVNIASIEGENPAPMHSHYNAAKGGVLMYTRSSAYELGAQGIRVNAVSPGLIWTEGIEESWPNGVQRWHKAAPLQRLGMPDDVADACLFLTSPAASWITGANLRVDGGVMARPSF